MRTIYPAILIAIVALTAGADTMPVNGLTMDANGMRAGDKLSREMLSFSPDMLCDTLKSWDFSQVPSEDTVRVTHYNRFGENLVVENENGENRLYCIDSIGRNLVRHYRGGMDIKYPESEDTDYPIMCGSFRQGKFFGEGKLGSLSYIKNAGFSSVSADMVAELITPDGDTIPDVLRMHYHRTGTTHIDGSFRHSFSETNDSSLFATDSICHWLATDSITQSIDKWQWYARGYRYPVIEMRSAKTYRYGAVTDSIQETYYYSLSNQLHEVDNDSINELYREMKTAGYTMPRRSFGNAEHGYGQQGNDGDDGIAGSMGGQSSAECHITPTYTSGNVTATCTLKASEGVSVAIYSSSGMMMWIYNTTLDTGIHEIECITSALNEGVYIVNVVIGNQQFSQRIVKYSE